MTPEPERDETHAVAVLERHQVCRRCNVSKPLSDFYVRHDLAEPRPVKICKQCKRTAGSAYYQENFHLWTSRAVGFKVTKEEIQALLEKQKGCCALCLKPQYQTRRGEKARYRLHCDHDHETGKLRGLLCNNCNSAVGRIAETAEMRARLVAYCG